MNRDTLQEALEERGFVETIEQEKLHAEPREPIDVLSQLRKRGALLNDAADELEERWSDRQPASTGSAWSSTQRPLSSAFVIAWRM